MQKLTTATELQQRLTHILDTVEREFRPLTAEQLRTKPANGGWSIVECLQHLNLAERYYVRQLQHKVDRLGLVQHTATDQQLGSGWVGRLLLSIVDPKSKRKFPAPGVVRPRTASDLD
ncbi:MAG: DinB family protein, partial [Rudanella sp.]|nr:DinB family protein [Rudanella sp.]